MVEDRKKQKVTGGVDLPIDVITEILSRLAIEDLVRFKAVCYTWYLITLDPSFRELQCKRASCKGQRAILQTNKNRLLLVDETRGNWICKKLSPEEVVPIRDNEIVGSCNGLLCIASSAGTLYIYNPITRAYEILPPASKKHIHAMFRYGFGFDPVSNKYKVVRVYRKYYYKNDNDLATRGEIITLGEGSWREITVPVNVLFKPKLKAVVSGGAFHWMIDKNDVRWSSSEGVLALDIHTEMFDTINFNADKGSLSEVECEKILLNFEKKLAIVKLDRHLRRVCVWELTGSKANDRWFQEYACFSLPTKESAFPIPCEILRMSSGGNLFVKDTELITRKLKGRVKRDCVAIYNQQGECDSIIHILKASEISKIHFFVPTLVSPRDIFREEKKGKEKRKRKRRSRRGEN